MMDEAFAFLKAIQPDEGVLFRVHAHCFSQFSGITDDIQHIIPNLERQTQAICEL